HPTRVTVPSELATPETYLGTARARGWVDGPQSGLHDYGSAPPARLSANEFAYSGTWRIAGQPAQAVSSAAIDVDFQAKNIYLVLSSPGQRPRPVRVLLDGHRIAAGQAGADVRAATVTVRGQRLYTLVSLPRVERHRLGLRFAPGVTGYAFTFG